MAAKLGAFRQNARIMREGDWIDLGPDWDGMRLKVRGQGRGYFDAKAIAENRAASKHGGDIALVPEDVLNRITAEEAGRHLLIDVADLEDAGGPVTVERYRELMQEPDYLALVSAVLVASEKLRARARQEARQAEGFSAPPSAGG